MANMFHIALLALLALLGVQQPSTSPAIIEGVVVKAGTREPLAGARIHLDRERDLVPRDPEQVRRELNQPPRGPGGEPPPPPQFHFSTTTGPGGRFVIENIPPGEYRLYATRAGGYVPGEWSAHTDRARDQLRAESRPEETDISFR